MQYARWATKEEIKERLLPINLKEGVKEVGIPLMYEGDTMYVDKYRAHTLLIGATGSGKTQTTILPIINLAMKANESLFVIDPKSEMYKRTANQLEKEGYKVTVIDFENTTLGNNWNPLSLAYQVYKEGNKDKAQDMVEEIGYYLFSEETNKPTDPFWLNATTDYFTGLTLYLFENYEENQINLSNVVMLSNEISGENSLEFLEKLDIHSTIYLNLVTTLKAPAETKGSILSVFQQSIKPYVSRENLSNLLSTTDTSYEDLLSTKSAIFIVTESSTIAKRLTPLYISQLLESKDLYNNNKPLNMLLDEFGNMLKLKNFTTLLSRARGLNVEITMVIQNYMQLVNVYGKEQTEMLKLCFANILYLLSNDIYSLEEISKMCGEVSKDVPLITVEELKTMKQFEAIVLTPRVYPYKTKLIPSYKIDWGYETEEKDIPKRTIQKISYIN
ncbi:MAG: type IV secretory system conjugative DNA transfer family protein [Candidatus Faecimonas sp.]|nr:type IV secretory system conjugative DNA transfer family protein [Mycoplasmatota bacterium]MDY2908514.1 type IV secretory system conjugative DNA transfer family protein [Candidatus Faecimonas sp.]